MLQCITAYSTLNVYKWQRLPHIIILWCVQLGFNRYNHWNFVLRMHHNCSKKMWKSKFSWGSIPPDPLRFVVGIACVLIQLPFPAPYSKTISYATELWSHSLSTVMWLTWIPVTKYLCTKARRCWYLSEVCWIGEARSGQRSQWICSKSWSMWVLYHTIDRVNYHYQPNDEKVVRPTGPVLPVLHTIILLPWNCTYKLKE